MSEYEIASLALQSTVAVAAFISVYLVLRQLRAMSSQIEATQNASEAQSIISIVEFLQAAEARDARAIVRGSLSQLHHSSWDEKQKRHASTVCANYDVVAALLKANLIRNKHVVLENWAPSVKHCYEILAPHIDATRREHGGHPKYWQNFDWLARQCAEAEA
ncbi:MAG TPA: hypothetical protein VM619_14245 [Luteimonas sp.]|nr:hypothetical protein [Luteimonas sp.]